jgi:hypothetical protein
MEILNPYDTFLWIKKVIESCDNTRQVLTCNRLIQNFELYHPKYIQEAFILRSFENLKYFEIEDRK